MGQVSNLSDEMAGCKPAPLAVVVALSRDDHPHAEREDYRIVHKIAFALLGRKPCYRSNRSAGPRRASAAWCTARH